MIIDYYPYYENFKNIFIESIHKYFEVDKKDQLINFQKK